MVNFEGGIIFPNIEPIFTFLTIDFYENLQEYISVWNQILILKNIYKIIKILNNKILNVHKNSLNSHCALISIFSKSPNLWIFYFTDY